MKRNAVAIVALVGGVILTGCTNGPDTTKERIESKEVYSLKDNTGGKEVEKAGTIDLLFKANGDVPYISLKEGLTYINLLRSQIDKDYVLSYKQEGDKAVYASPNQADATIDIKEQTITYHDFSVLINHIQPYKDTHAMLTPDKNSSLHLLSNEYAKGNTYTIDLKNYSRIDVYKHGEDFYLPLTTYNDLFLGLASMTNLVYNFDKVFLLTMDAVFATKDEEDEDVLTPLGKAFYNKTEDEPTVSKGYAEYNYQNICLNFDYFYGVRGLKGREYTTFDDYLATKGYKEDLLSGDVRKMDAAYAYALSTFKDFHTGMNRTSPLYPFGSAYLSPSKMDPETRKEEEEGEALNAARATSGANLGFAVDEKNRIAYVAFNEFSAIDEEALGKSSWTTEDLANSATLFAHAYKEITTKYMSTVDYVAVDLATNNGGSSDSMVYILGILLGKISFDIQNPFTGDHAKSTYAVDINHDGKVDEKDVSLREHGKKIVFIDTHFAFSCGNALPAFAKINYPEQVITIGETTGGGTCAVRPSYNALGTFYYISGLQMLSKRNGDKLESIEAGVAADIALPSAKDAIDRNAVVKALLAKQ